MRAAATALASAVTLAGAFAASPLHAAEFRVEDQVAYRSAVRKAAPGDTIVLANGEWRDFEIVFAGEGLPGRPITLRAETKGQVRITGRSNLRLGGTHLVVADLVFADGYTPTRDVISFRRTKEHLANHSRVTEVVIDRFNNPERFETDFWVTMHGRHNRFDHSYLVGKRNSGVTMAVRLDAEASQRNEHRIDHNYFGRRPTLGSNGGETLRVGTSKYSLVESRTVVEKNIFERCNGEVEIISSKSGGNVFRGNLFLESRGTLTLRHGNGSLVEGNVFLGNGVDHTGGIRIINARQTVRGNYLFGLTGRRFGGALVVMNGVPNSPINRYHRVEDAVIENNTVIDGHHIELAAGSDAERSATPRRSRMAGNLIVNTTPRRSVTAHDDIGGIAFEGNIASQVEALPEVDGIATRHVTLAEAANGLKYPVGPEYANVGAPRDLVVLRREDVGPPWYPKPTRRPGFGTGQTRRIEPGDDALTKALEQVGAGDVVELSAGEYVVAKIATIAQPITVRAAPDAASRPLIRFERSALFELAEGGRLELARLAIDGSLAPDAYGNAVVRTSRYSMLANYSVRVVDAEVRNLNTNHSFNFLRVAKHTFAREIEIVDSTFQAVTGDVVALNAEVDDVGIYNGEYVAVRDSTFSDVEGAVLNIYRGGTDESTFGPHVTVRGNRFANVGNGKRNKTDASVFLHGAQWISIEDNDLRGSRPVRLLETVGEPIVVVARNRLVETPPAVLAKLSL